MYKSKNLRGSSSQQAAAAAEAETDPSSVIQGRRHRTGDSLRHFSTADNRSGNLWSSSDYTCAVYVSVDSQK